MFWRGMYIYIQNVQLFGMVSHGGVQCQMVKLYYLQEFKYCISVSTVFT